MVVAQRSLGAALKRLRLLVIPLEWTEESVMTLQDHVWGLPTSITFALSWQPLCCSSSVRGVECGAARGV